MPRPMSLAGLIEKNKLEQDSPWLFLFDIIISDTLTMHLVNYAEEVLWTGVTYSPMYLRMDAIKETSDGSIPSITVTVSNVMREMEALLQSYGGLRGCKVTVHVVNKDHLEVGELVQSFVITETSSNAEMVTFTLEKPIPALEVYIPRRTFTNDEFPGIEDNARY